VPRLFFLLSGEHEDLPTSELKAILETEGYPYEAVEKLDQVLRLSADPACVEPIKRRAAFTRLCGLELFNCRPEISSIIKALQTTGANDLVEKNESFVVRVKHVKTHGSNINGMALEKKLGAIIKDKASDARVNLKNPDKTFVGILTNARFVFGLKLADIPAKPFVDRRPRRKPFFHPSAMQAKLARCMVNLARPKARDLVLDPFSGTGGILIEAACIGCRILGLDIQRRMAKGTLRNLAHFKIEPEGVIVGDARNLPIKEIDCVVTDPPYGRSTITFKRTTERIIQEVLTSVQTLLPNGKRICVAAPKTLNAGRIGVALGYRHLESQFVYVHRTLTREIIVFEKV
jgi:tRNA (guanine10-N2)-dimethyltransferase